MGDILTANREYLSAVTSSALEVHFTNPDVANLHHQLALPAYVGITVISHGSLADRAHTVDRVTEFDEFQRPVYEGTVVNTGGLKTTFSLEWVYTPGSLDYAQIDRTGSTKTTTKYHWIDENSHDFRGEGRRISIDRSETEDGGLLFVSKVHSGRKAYVERATYNRQGFLVNREYEDKNGFNNNSHVNAYTYDSSGRLIRVERLSGSVPHVASSEDETDPISVTTFDYDASGGVHMECLAKGLQLFTEDIRFDSLGRPTVIDRSNRVFGIIEKHIEVEYDNEPSLLVGLDQSGVPSAA